MRWRFVFSTAGRLVAYCREIQPPPSLLGEVQTPPLGSLKYTNLLPTPHKQYKAPSPKFAIAYSLDTLGVGYSAEVHGAFAPVIPPAAQADARRFMQRGREGAQRGQRQGLVPDFKIELERLVDGASTTAVLAELKVLHAGRTASNPIGGCTYNTRGNSPHCVLMGHRRAVHRRAGKIQGERVNDVRRIEARFCGTQPGNDWPVLDRLRNFGEWNDGLERLVSLACDDAAPRIRALFGTR